jgi:hypothetical protein
VCRALRDSSGGTSVIILFGPPGRCSTYACFQDVTSGSGGFSETEHGRFCLCPVCGPWFDYWGGVPGSHVALDAHWHALPECTCPPMQRDVYGEYPLDRDGLKRWCDECYSRTDNAVAAASGARFEHGENGAADLSAGDAR